METTHTLNSKEHNVLTNTKKTSNSASGIFSAIRKGLRAAAATKVCPNDKEAIKRILSED